MVVGAAASAASRFLVGQRRGVRMAVSSFGSIGLRQRGRGTFLSYYSRCFASSASLAESSKAKREQSSLGRFEGAGDSSGTLGEPEPSSADNSDLITDKKSASKDDLGGFDAELKKQLLIISVSQLMLNLGFSQIVPVLPLFASQFAEASGGYIGGATGLGMIIAAPSAARLCLNLPLGRLTDTIGRKPLMVAGTFLTSLGTFATPFASSVAAMIPFRLLVGAGSASSMAGATAMLADYSDRAPQHRGKIMGINAALVGSVWIVGPAMGGFLAEQYGLTNSFLIAGACALACSFGYSRLPETLPPSKESDAGKTDLEKKMTMAQRVQSWVDDMRPILQNRNQQALIALSCVFPLRFACFSTVVMLHASDAIGAGPQEMGLMFTALALSQGIGMPCGSWLVDNTSPGPRKKIILPAALLQCAAFGSLAFASSVDHFYAAMAVQGFASGFIQPAISTFTAELTEQKNRGQALSLQRQAGDAIFLLGPLGFGYLADVTSFDFTILVTSGLLLLGNGTYLLRSEKLCK